MTRIFFCFLTSFYFLNVKIPLTDFSILVHLMYYISVVQGRSPQKNAAAEDTESD